MSGMGSSGGSGSDDGGMGSGSVRARSVGTDRLQIALLESGPPDGVPVVFLHGNLSTSRFWTRTMESLPARYRALAPDLRGFGDTEPRPIDATRGVRDFADDLHALAEALELVPVQKLHLVGWSVGGSVVMQYATDHPDAVASLTLVDPMSPYGFGGTRDHQGTSCWPDYAGSGGGTANPDFVQLLASGERGAENPFAPLNVMNNFYFKPPFRTESGEEAAFLEAMLSTRIGDDHYPGDLTSSDNWPGVAPGTRGMNNAISPKYCNLGGFAEIHPQPDVLWIRGADDQIVSDTSMFDFGYLGQLGAVPGWPGEEVYPPQPMVDQMRAVLETYQLRGGKYKEEVVPDCGHSPHIEQPKIFRELLGGFLDAHS